MSQTKASQDLYKNTIVIDGLNISNWDSPAVFQSLYAGGLTAINATCSVWEDYPQTMDNITAWLHRFVEYKEILMQVKSVQDIYQAKQVGKVASFWAGKMPLRLRTDLID